MPDAVWESFQLRHLNNSSMLSITNKSRQVGWSWLAAAEAVAIAKVEPRSTSIFVSINQDEAGEKIRYAKGIIEAIHKSQRPRLIIDNRLEIEFDNGSRLISHPCRPVRGKARARIYLDEFAHYQKDHEIYQSALPVISKGGVIRIGSSPLGASGQFWEIFSQTLQPYPGYHRDLIPWWQVAALCTDVDTATRQAPRLPTAERVRRFGSERLTQIFDNFPLEDFQQEFENAWVDESVAWLDWDLIKRNQALAQDDKLTYRRARTKEAAFMAIDETAEAISRGEIEAVLAGGMDIGRRVDTTELVFVGRGQTQSLPYRLGISLDRQEFSTQEAILNYALDTLPISQMLIDQNGLGMQLAENAVRRYGVRVQPAVFTNPSKEIWAVEVKVRMQKSELPIPTDRDFAYQIHSLRKKITDSKNVVFDVEASEKHHADQFWAWALAVWAGHDLTYANDWIKAIHREKEPKPAGKSLADLRKKRR